MTEVDTTHGRLRGTVEDGLHVFRGVPFGRAERFRAPEPADPWDGSRDATAFGPACPQGDGTPPEQQTPAMQGPFAQGDLALDEDCLYLNVWTPGCDGARRAVMVWIHGGGFTSGTGASSMYSGAGLAARGDVVVVSINYRLGPFGFAYLPGVTTPNAGLLDQALALRWVREEIASFGGDPGNVTIFGESAGAKSVEWLLALPAAQGLFHRAIMQSTYDPDVTVASAEAASRAIAEDLGGVERLSSVSPYRLLAAAHRYNLKDSAATGGIAVVGSRTAPVVDGEVLKKTPPQAIADGDLAGVPILIGTTLDESRLFAAMAPDVAGLTDETLVEKLGRFGVPDASRAAEVYRRTLASRREAVTAADIWLAASTDRLFRAHSIRLAEEQTRHQQDTFMYLFTWPAQGAMGVQLGSCHALDIPFVFGTLGQGIGALAGDGPEARKLTEAMQDAWLTFARGGQPWPAYDSESRRTQVLGREVTVATAPLEDERLLWAR